MSNSKDRKKVCAYIDLDALAHNYNYTKSLVGKRVICVVKADAYGHGAIKVARRLEAEGADFFAAATIDEALELRENGINSSIIILGYILPCCLEYAVENDISVSLASYEFAKECVRAAAGKTLKVHIKLNTGMNRTGFDVCHDDINIDLAKTITLLRENPNIVVEGLFSHFAKAEDDDAFSRLQFERYIKTRNYLAGNGIMPGICHLCNSAGIINFNDMRMDAVRLGISMYGCSTPNTNYKPVMQFKTVIVDTHELFPGDGVSYGLTFRADKKMRMAVIGAGYADGLRRSLSCGKGVVLCRGKRATILGRVCMDMAMIDISHIPDAKVGDEVVIWGFDGNEYLSCDEQAENAGTISYELMCGVNKRVARIYKDSKQY